MNKILILSTALIALSVGPSIAQSVTIESGAMISNTADYSRSKLLSLADPGAGMIRAMGWRCDSVSVIRPYMMSRGFTMVCNNFSYTYNFSDKGGNWVVELK